MWRASARIAALVAAAVLAVTGWPAVPAAVWLALGAWRWPGIVARRPARIGYYAGLLALMTVAVALVPYAMFASWILALHAFALFRGRAAFAWSVAGALLITSAQQGGPAEPTTAISLLAPVVAAGWYLSRENDERRRLQAALVEQTRIAAVRAERNRMAREIHDTIAQDLSAAVALLEGAVSDGVREERVGRARDLARSGLAEARRSVLALGPGSLEGSSLAGALRHLVVSWTARTGVDGSFESDPDARPLDAGTEAALFRVGQSALANVAEHARATRVRVTLSYLDDEVVLDVRDDGVGFDPAAVCDGDRGFGLPGMRQRLHDLGGTLDVETQPGGGTSVRAAVPVR
jgi:signal transduction histidine kinase